MNPKFDLLCLQEDEYYFRDYACQFSLTAATATDSRPAAALQLGVLKLCSSSVYLVPETVDEPVVRIPLDCVASLAE
jgi:hypothetical protein